MTSWSGRPISMLQPPLLKRRLLKSGLYYNVALGYTSAARGSLALSTLPLATMLVGSLLGVEALTRRKTTGVLIAIGGVALALATGLANAPAGAWRGDLAMLGATLIMALYSANCFDLRWMPMYKGSGRIL